MNEIDKGHDTLDFLMDKWTANIRFPFRKDRSLLNAIVFGVTRWRKKLDHVISHFSNTPFENLHPVVRNVLRMGAFSNPAPGQDSRFGRREYVGGSCQGQRACPAGELRQRRAEKSHPGDRFGPLPRSGSVAGGKHGRGQVLSRMADRALVPAIRPGGDRKTVRLDQPDRPHHGAGQHVAHKQGKSW